MGSRKRRSGTRARGVVTRKASDEDLARFGVAREQVVRNEFDRRLVSLASRPEVRLDDLSAVLGVSRMEVAERLCAALKM